MNFVDPQFLPEEICISNLENPALITLIEIGQKSEVPGKEGKHNRLFAWEIPINREGGFDMDEIKHTQREENTAGHFCICNAGPEAFLTGTNFSAYNSQHESLSKDISQPLHFLYHDKLLVQNFNDCRKLIGGNCKNNTQALKLALILHIGVQF